MKKPAKLTGTVVDGWKLSEWHHAPHDELWGDYPRRTWRKPDLEQTASFVGGFDGTWWAAGLPDARRQSGNGRDRQDAERLADQSLREQIAAFRKKER